MSPESHDEEDLRDELLRRAERDQSARGALSDPPNPQEWMACESVDRENYTWLEAKIVEHGWPGTALVGADGAHAAWLIAQHAPLELQQRWLPLLSAAVTAGQAGAVDLAYLDDRVRCGEGRPQRYGTQWLVRGDQRRLEPVDEPDKVNERRALLCLPPLNLDDLVNSWPPPEPSRIAD